MIPRSQVAQHTVSSRDIGELQLRAWRSKYRILEGERAKTKTKVIGIVGTVAMHMEALEDWERWDPLMLLLLLRPEPPARLPPHRLRRHPGIAYTRTRDLASLTRLRTGSIISLDAH